MPKVKIDGIELDCPSGWTVLEAAKFLGLEIPTLIHADNSPGRLMRQREAYIRKALDELHEAGLLTIESKANLDQIRYKSSITWLDAVRLYYQNSNP